ncbi:MAG: nucleoside-diphosphate sugar epimerase [Microvirga sp.]|jgi:mitochondrial fission protein ELM1|nr:nucleoside-diphosphate sugar epimerase [Microvirga sp.]
MVTVRAWIVTDGKAGDELQCLAVAEALGITPEIRRIGPRAPFWWLTPYGPIDIRDRPSRRGSPIAPPFPDLLIGSGRRAVPYVRKVKRASRGRTFTVFLKDPVTGPRTADLIWVPEHDKLRGPNIVTTITPPHRVSPERLAAARAEPDPRLASLARPRVAVLAGGASKHYPFHAEDAARFLAGLTRLAATGVGLMATTSRRTPEALRDGLASLVARHGGFLWDGKGQNPYIALLALADAIVVTADSYNMVGEAAATGAPILVFEPSGGHPKLRAFLEDLERHGAVKRFEGRLEAFRYEPLDSTPTIAEAVREGLARHRRGLGLAGSAPQAPEIP